MNSRDSQHRQPFAQTRDQIHRLQRMLERPPLLATLWPLFLGMVVANLTTTVLLALVPSVPPWRWFFQGAYTLGAFVLCALGWRARREWKRRP